MNMPLNTNPYMTGASNMNFGGFFPTNPQMMPGSFPTNNFNNFPGAPQSFNQPPPAFNPPINPVNLTGPGPSIASFQKDGFKIMGREPIKPKNDEG